MSTIPSTLIFSTSSKNVKLLKISLVLTSLSFYPKLLFENSNILFESNYDLELANWRHFGTFGQREQIYS